MPSYLMQVTQGDTIVVAGLDEPFSCWESVAARLGGSQLNRMRRLTKHHSIKSEAAEMQGGSSLSKKSKQV